MAQADESLRKALPQRLAPYCAGVNSYLARYLRACPPAQMEVAMFGGTPDGVVFPWAAQAAT